jgi:hypothetical protein
MAKDKNAFGYKESDEFEEGGSWLSGLAEFRFSGDEKKVKVKVTDYKKKVTKVAFSAKLLPDVPEKFDEDDVYGISLRLDEDGDVEEVETIYPANWMGEVMRPADISRRDDLPTPIDISFQQGTRTIEYQKFIIRLEFVKGEFKGAQVPYWLKYVFCEREDGMTMFSGNPDNPKATQIRKTAQFCLLTGAVDENLEWPDDGNILPELWARIEDADVLLITSGKDGQVDTVLRYEPEDEEDEKPKKGKKGKKSKKAKEEVVEEEEEDDLDDDNW